MHKNITVSTLRFLARKKPQKYRKIMFNLRYLRKMRSLYGTLHCVYCNVPVLVPTLGGQTVKAHLATVDHFLPTSQNPHLEYDESNLRVCCEPCNSRKADKIWEEKYPY